MSSVMDVILSTPTNRTPIRLAAKGLHSIGSHIKLSMLKGGHI